VSTCRKKAREETNRARTRAEDLDLSAMEARAAAAREDGRAERLTEEGNLEAASRAAAAAARLRASLPGIDKDLMQAWANFDAASGEGSCTTFIIGG
jgi:hypothetical protein